MFSLSEKAFPQTLYTTKTQRQMDYVEDENGQKGKNKTMCFAAVLEERHTRSGLQSVIFPNQSSLMDSLPQERKKSQESENSGQKKSLQTK